MNVFGGRFLAWALLLTSAADVGSSLNSWGKNVCSHQVSKSRRDYRSCTKSRQELYKTNCPNFWGAVLGWTKWGFTQCKRSRTVHYQSYCAYTDYYSETVYVCCYGWQQTGSDCRTPICRGACYHGGHCVGPDTCFCPSGWVGKRCEQVCMHWRYGQGCSKACPCDPQKAHGCVPTDGRCLCKAGYKGDRCKEECPSGTFGAGCKQKCGCQNGGGCSHIDGRCDCPSGFRKPDCSSVCEEGRWGPNCVHTCECQNSAHCDAPTGRCSCMAGWTGKHCDQSCPPMSWGPYCKHNCTCENGAVCNKTNGDCVCSPGFIGQACERECPHGRYGQDCASNCTCLNGGLCNFVDGSCTCLAGYTSENCSTSCPMGTFGIGCLENCTCQNGRCSPIDGECACYEGWQGYSCQKPCSNDTFGLNCSKQCKCENGAACDPVSGSCACTPGYIGKTCSERCGDGYYGYNCSLACSCDSGADSCNHITGKCRCLPGWKGDNCSVQCQPDVVDVTDEDDEVLDTDIDHDPAKRDHSNRLLIVMAVAIAFFMGVLVLAVFVIIFRLSKTTHQMHLQPKRIAYSSTKASVWNMLASDWTTPVEDAPPPYKPTAEGKVDAEKEGASLACTTGDDALLLEHAQ